MLFSLLWLTAAFAYPPDAINTYSFDIGADYKLDLEPILGATPLTSQDLEKNLRQAKDYAAFLTSLKARYPELFLAPVFLHDTGSLQRADFHHPRVLLYGRGSILALGGADKTPKVEMIHYDAATNAYETTEITFPGAPRFEHRPSSCVACHGQPIRPLWEPYDIWPKAYGVFSGMFQDGPEKTEFASFLKDRMKLGGIYRLIDDPPGYTTGSDSELVGPVAFTEYLSSLHFIKVLRDWAKLPQLAPYRYALTAALSGCMITAEDGGTSAEWQPDRFLPAPFPAPYSYFRDDTAAGKSAQFRYLDGLYASLFPKEKLHVGDLEGRLLFENDIYAPVRYVLENLGLRWSDYSLTDGGNSYSMNVPSNLPVDLATLTPLLDARLPQELQPKRIEVTGMQSKRLQYDCAALAARSVPALGGVTPPPSVPAPQRFDDPVAGLSPMSRCVRCHVAERTLTGPLAPYIPFENTMKLRDWLRTGGNWVKLSVMVNYGAMPKAGTLTAQERSALLEALEKLSKE